jgi:hypothetical protein
MRRRVRQFRTEMLALGDDGLETRLAFRACAQVCQYLVAALDRE